MKQIPKNPQDYVIVNSDTSIILHKNGFMPKYMSLSGDCIFYKKTDKILEFMKSNNLCAL
jgi:hypothetical protein